MTEYRIPEVSISLVRDTADIKLRCPEDAETAVRHLCCKNPTTESFCVLYLDGQNRLISGRVVAMGGASYLSVKAREVFQGACDAGASALVLGHNHPSGNPTPSTDDRSMTETLVNAGEVLGIPVVDHLIVTDCGRQFSFLKNDMI